MSEEFAVSLESPQSGWMSVRLKGSGGQQLLLSVSHAPEDSLRALMVCLTSLVRENRSCTVRWNCEPDEYDFELRATDAVHAELTIRRYPDHRRTSSRAVFRVRTTKRALAQSFCRELADLRRRSHEDAFAQNWRRPFPEREFQELRQATGDA